MSDQEITVAFKANIQKLLDGMSQASSATQDTAQKINGHIEGIGKGFEHLMGTLGVISGVLAGGAMFKESINETVKWTMEVNKLSKLLGTSLQEASAWAVSLHGLGISVESVQGITGALTNRIAQGGEAFRKAGIEIKDSEGRLKPMASLIPEIADKAKEFTTEGDKNAFLATVLGRRWMEFMPILRNTAERMEEAREEAKKFGLEVDASGVAKTREYQESMRKMELVTLSMKNALGKELMPVLTSVGQFLGGEGSKMVEGFGYVLKGVIQVFYVLKAVIETLVIFLTAAFSNMITIFMTLGEVMSKVISGDFKGAVNAAKQGVQDIKNETEAAAEGISTAWSNMAKNSKELWKPTEKPKAAEQAAGPAFDPNAKDKKPNLVGEWTKEFEKAKALLVQQDGDLAVIDRDAEIAFWQSKLAKVKQGSEEWVTVRLKISALMKQANDEEVKEAEKTAQQTLKVADLRAKNEVDAAKNAIEVKKANLERAVALGQITHAQELVELKKFHAEELKIEIDALEAEKALHANDPVKVQEIENRILAVKRKSNLDVQKLNTESAKEEMKLWDQVASGITSSLGTALTSILTRTKSFSSAIQGLFQSLSTAFTKMSMDMAMEWVKGELIKKAATISRATTNVTANAVEAGAGATASAASIPVYGWMIALAAGAAVLAGVMGTKSTIGSAAGGWDIPSGLNPMAQLHEEEMVLPKEQANVIRDMAKGGAGGSQTHVHIHAMDARSFKQALMNNQGGLMDVLRDAGRNGRR